MRWLPILRVHTLQWHTDPLVALISLQILQDALRTWGYLAVMAFIMIESAGIPFPGETMLLLASFSAATLVPQLHIGLIIAFAALGAILGDNIGYYVGRTGGRTIIERYGRYVFLKPQHLKRAEKFFEKHGNKTVFFGRFIAILRTWSAFLAGVNHMHWRVFLLYNAAGGIAWAIIYGTLGFVAGRVFHDNFPLVEQIARTTSWIGAAVIVILAVCIFLVIRVRRSRRSQAVTHSENSENELPSEHASPTGETPATTILASASDEYRSTKVISTSADETGCCSGKDPEEESTLAKDQAKDER